MTDEPEHGPDPTHVCPVCAARAEIAEVLRYNMAETLRAMIAESAASIAAGQQTDDEKMDVQIQLLAATEMLMEMEARMGVAAPVEQSDGVLH